MSTWFPLDRTRAHAFYCLPLAITTREPNPMFMPALYPIDIDGPWPLVIVLRDTPTAPTFQLTLCTVYEEALEQSLNPLEWETGYLFLDRARALGLASLIREQSLLTPADPAAPSESAFERLTDAEARSFRFMPEQLPTTTQHFYRVRYLNDGLSTTILTFSYNAHPPRRTLHMAVIAIMPAQREDPAWQASDHATGTVHLNEQMGLELAAMLESYGGLIDL
jgi:hypothetical protein